MINVCVYSRHMTMQIGLEASILNKLVVSYWCVSVTYNVFN